MNKKKQGMKQNNSKHEINHPLRRQIIYCDLATSADRPLKLLANLLLNSKKPLEVDDLVEIGAAISKYLSQRSILDYFFWNRSLRLCDLPELEILKEIEVLKNHLQL